MLPGLTFPRWSHYCLTLGVSAWALASLTACGPGIYLAPSGTGSAEVSPPRYLSVSGAASISLGPCHAFQVETASAVDSPTNVTLSGVGSAEIYSSRANCLSHSSATTSLTIAANSSSTNFWIRTETEETLSLRASGDGFTSVLTSVDATPMNFSRGSDQTGTFNGFVRLASGKIMAFGSVSSLLGSATNEAVRFNEDTTRDTSFSALAFTNGGFSSAPNAAVELDDGSSDVVFGGGFNSYGGNGVSYLVRVNANGSFDSGFSGPAIGSAVNTLLPVADGTGYFYAGGTFTSPTNRIIRITNTGATDATFNVGSGFNGTVLSMAPAGVGTSDIYVGGSFTTYQGGAANKLIRLKDDGTVIAAFNVGAGFDGNVTAIAPLSDGSGDIMVGGTFTTYQGAAAVRIVRLNSDGTVDGSFVAGAGLTTDSILSMSVSEIVMTDDTSGDFYVVGSFQRYKGTIALGLARIRANGDLDTSFVASADGTVKNISYATDSSGDLHLIGSSTYAYNGQSLAGIARISGSGTVVTKTGSFARLPVYGSTASLLSDGRLAVGSQSTSYDGKLTSEFAFSSAEGSGLDINAGTGISPNSVNYIFESNDGSNDIYILGNFWLLNGATSQYIARLNSDGSHDTGFNVGSGASNTPFGGIASPAADGDVYVCGGFANYNGTAVNGIVRLNSNGSIDSGFNVGTGFVGTCRALMAVADGSGDIIAAGDFTSYNGTSVNRIVRLNSDGTIDSTLAQGSGFNNFVFTLAPVGDSTTDFYAAGLFTTYKGAGANSIIRLTQTGTAVASFSTGSGLGSVYSIASAVDGSGDLYVTGGFTTYQGSTSSAVIRLNADGSLDSAFNTAASGYTNGGTVIPLNDGSYDVILARQTGNGVFNGRNVGYFFRLTESGAFR